MSNVPGRNLTRLDMLRHLEKLDKSDLIKLLHEAYEKLGNYERVEVFTRLFVGQEDITPVVLEPEQLLAEVRSFYDDSLNRVYFKVIRLESYNYDDLPRETDEWFERLGDLLEYARRLSEQSEHRTAFKCFKALWGLFQLLGEQDIVFGHEVGEWNIGMDTDPIIEAYIRSVIATHDEHDFPGAIYEVIQLFNHWSGNEPQFECIKTVASPQQLDRLVLFLEARGERIPEITG